MAGSIRVARGSGGSCVTALMLAWVWSILLVEEVYGLRFYMDREQCFQYDVEERGSDVHSSFVILRRDSSWFSKGVDLTVEGPHGRVVYSVKQIGESFFNFTAEAKGLYKFCFSNNNQIHTTVDFEVSIGPKLVFVKSEHFEPLMDQISNLSSKIFQIRFEQHWLQAQTDRQAIVNQEMSKRVLYKAIVESFALVGVSLLQVYLLHRLFCKETSWW